MAVAVPEQQHVSPEQNSASNVTRRPMTEAVAELISGRLRTLGQPLRLRLIDLVDLRPDMTVQELADVLGATQQNVSQHLAILFRAGVLGRKKDGTRVHYFLADRHTVPLLENAAAGIGQQLAELSRVVEAESS